MEKKQIRISVEECIEVAAYGLQKDVAKTIKRHYQMYSDWNRTKDLLQKELLYEKAEQLRKGKALKKAEDALHRISEMEMFPCYANDFKSKNGWRNTGNTESE